MARLEDLIRDKILLSLPDQNESIDVVLRPAPWDAEEEAISVPYKRSDDKYARSSPTLPTSWAYAVAVAGVDRFFPKAWVADFLAHCIKRLGQ